MFSGLARLALPSLATLLLAAPASAAVISWGTATNISGDLDVATSGSLVTAVNFGNTGVAGATVNGVTFTAFAVGNVLAPTAATGLTIAGVKIAESPGDLVSSNLLGSGSGSFASLSSNYRTLLGSAAAGSIPAAVTVTLGAGAGNSLVIGRQYLLQVWVNTSSANGPFSLTSTSTFDSKLLDSNFGNSAGNLGQWVSGSFTANATTQTFTITGSPIAQINALQLRDVTPSGVPETSSMILLVAGSCGLMLAAGARRRRG